MSQQTGQITSIILCGGSARRLGGLAKPLLEIDGQPIVASIAARIKHLGPILISANGNQQHYAQFGEVVADAQPDQGPLAGLHASLQQVTTSRVLVIPGDCPDYHLAVAQRLLDQLAEQNADAVCAHDGQQQQYLHLALRHSVVESLGEYLSRHGRSVKGWLQKLQPAIADCAEHASAFADIDNPDDLQRRRAHKS